MSTLLDNRYELIERIGDGGMAEVYRAHDKMLDRFVAIKILHPQFTNDESFIKRFRREAQGAAKLSHSNIVNIYDVGSCDGKYYIVMEYIKGETLKEKIKRESPLPIDVTLRIVKEIAEALENAHANHLVHCDIKPHNILLNEYGHVKVADFGIARATTSSTITYTGSVVGSVHYFSPEQAKGHTISPKSDIYSLGVVMYEMLTGQVPFNGETAVSIAIKHLQDAPIPPHELRTDIPPLVEAIVLKAMDKNPDNRFTSSEMIKEIAQAQAKPFAQNVNMPVNDPFATRILTDDEMAQLQNIDIKPAPKVEVKKAKKVKKQAPAPVYQEEYQDNMSSANSKSSKSVGFFNKKFGFSLAIILVLGFCIGAFLSYGDFWSSKTVTVPNVVGMSQAQAEETLKAENLRVEIAETFDENVPEGKVASQTPEAGKNVKENRLVSIYISKGGEEITMPNLVGMSQSEAEKQLATLKMKIGQVKAEFSSQPKGTILQQSISANSKANKGASVDIVVSKGQEIKKVTVPNVEGMSVESAKAILSEQGLSASSSASSGQVISQSVPAGSQVDSGSTIELTVGNAQSTTTVDSEKSHANSHNNNDSSNSNLQDKAPAPAVKENTNKVAVPQREIN